MVVLKTKKKTVFLNTESIESTSVKLEFYLQQIEHCLKTYPEKHMMNNVLKKRLRFT